MNELPFLIDCLVAAPLFLISKNVSEGPNEVVIYSKMILACVSFPPSFCPCSADPATARQIESAMGMNGASSFAMLGPDYHSMVSSLLLCYH